MAKENKVKEGSSRPRKRRREDTKHNKVSQSKLKKQIRDVQRLLNRENLKANIREDNERALASLKHQLDITIKSSAEDKMAKRYQMVRFVERQKATRRLRQAEKAYENDPTIENKKLVEKYTLDLYYTIHFPLTEKYIALYPKSEIETQQELDKRDRIRRELQEEMLHGKKKSSGSNALELGSRKSKKQESNDELESDEDDMHSEKAEESEEDEFLDLGHKKR